MNLDSRMPGRRAERRGNGFWARQSPKDRLAVVAIAFEIVLSAALVVVGLRLDNSQSSLPGRFTLLAANVVALVAALQFTISRFFDDQNERIEGVGHELDELRRQVARSVTELESITTFSETYVKIAQQVDVVRNQYQSTLDNFLLRLSNCIDDRRSGALDIMDYYGALEDLARAIEQDKAACDGAGVSYTGEIWALSFVLDDEWDDSSLQETRWFERLEQLDRSGIGTRRLWALDKKMAAALAMEPIGAEGRELIRRLSLYCADDTAFANTTSVAIPKELISDEHVRLFGKGFFAGAFSNSGLRLIRGVCFDNLLSSNSLGGEIDFDDDRIAKIRRQWERYLVLGRPLKRYLSDIGSASAKTHMTETWSSPRTA